MHITFILVFSFWCFVISSLTVITEKLVNGGKK